MNKRFTFSQGSMVLLLLCLMAGASLANAERGVFEIMEGAAEIERIVLKTGGTQIVYTRECDQCPMLSLSVTPQTLFYDGASRIPQATAATINRGATVFFDKGERVVTRIVFWQ